MTAIKQASFAGGRLAPNLYGRSDLAKWQAGLAECRNFWINRFGNIENRTGTNYLGTTKNGVKVRLLPFVISNSQSYELEVGPGYIRPWRNGAQIIYPASSLPTYAVFTQYRSGQMIYNVVLGVTYFYVAYRDFNSGGAPGPTGVSDDDWYVLSKVTINAVDYGIYEIPVPVITADNIPVLQYAQLNDVMTITHQDFQPFQLNYKTPSGGVEEWGTIYNILINDVSNPGTVGVTAGAAGAVEFKYVVVSIDSDLVTQSRPGYGNNSIATTSIQAIADDSFVVTTSGAHNYTSGDIIFFGDTRDFSGISIYAYQPYIITVLSPTTFSINDLIPPVSSIDVIPNVVGSYYYIITSADPTPVAPNHITWSGGVNVAKYNIYRLYKGVWAYIGSSNGLAFDDDGTTPNVGAQLYSSIPMFQSIDDFPAVVGYFQQRLWLGNTVNQPQSLMASRIGHYGSFDVNTPVDDASAVSITLSGRQVQFIHGLSDVGKLIIHTSNGEYVANGNQANVVTPTAINIVQCGYAGSTKSVPLGIGTTTLFIQSRGNQIRDLQFSIQVYNYAGKDTTKLASDLFIKNQVLYMDWQQNPNSLIWAILDNGALLSMTYAREEEMWAWARHDTQAGLYEALCVVPEDNLDVLYVVVNRVVGGVQTRYMERFNPRNYTDITTDAVFSDSSLTYDGRNTGSTTMTLTTGAGWTPTDVITITASAGFFVVGDVGNTMIVQEIADGTQLQTFSDGSIQPYAVGTIIDQVKLNIIGYASATVVTALPQKTVPTWAQATALTTWGKAVHQFSGLNHLEGMTVTGLGDGNVMPTATVASGAITTQDNYMVLHVGLPITAQVQTLDWESVDGPTVAGKKKIVNEITGVFAESRGGTYGMLLNSMFPFPQRQAEPYDTANYLLTGPIRFPISGGWAPTAQIWVQQVQPLPMCLSAIIPTGSVGG